MSWKYVTYSSYQKFRGKTTRKYELNNKGKSRKLRPIST